MRTLLFALALCTALLGACTVPATSHEDGGVRRDAPASDAYAPPDGGRVCSPGSTIGRACVSSADCSDGCYCNGVEGCTDGVCVARPSICQDDVACTTAVCDEDTDTCTFTTDDTQCQDGDACNGAEVCVVGLGCRPGPRLTCTDGDPCTVGVCDPATGCSFVLRDLDHDGYADERCGGDDCDDDPVLGATRNPEATEVCGNLVDDDCDGRTDYRQLSCTATNDTCATAETLPGPGTYVRTTRGAASDYALGCRPTGIDTVFRFSLATPQDVEIALSVEGSTGAVAIRPAASCTTGPDAYCDDESALARNLAAGDYVAIVRTGTGATFSLTLTYQSATPVQPVDVCNATTLDISAGGHFTGFYSDVFDDYHLMCHTGTSSFRDVAYRMTLAAESDVVLTASSAGSSSLTTYLALVRDCTSEGTTLACVQRASAEIRRRSLAPGTYYVLLEPSVTATSTTARTWTLDATITPAAPRNEGDACSTEVDITNATATVPLSMLELDYGTSCGGATTASRDASFSFELTDVSDVVLTTDLGGLHYVSVAPSCGDPATAVACISGTPRTSQRFLRLPAGIHHVTVSTSLTSGSITASAMIEPPTFPPPDDTCAGASSITEGVALASSTRAAADDVVSCGNAGSPDAIHRLVLTEDRNVTLVARRTDGSGEPLSIGLRSDCAAPGADLACGTGSPALLNRTLSAGTYYVVVESAASATGPYSIVAFLSAP